MAKPNDLMSALPLVFVSISDGCNSKCISCDIWKAPRRNIDMALVSQMAAEFSDLGVELVGLTGGEAMQHPEWPKIATLFRQAGARVLLFTNGIFLRKQLDDVINNVDSVTVSLDASDEETYRQIRGVKALSIVLEGIKAVSSRKPTVMTRTTIQRLNFRQIPSIIDLALKNGAGRASFLTVDVASSEAFGLRSLESKIPGEQQNLNEEEIEEFSEIIARLEKTHREHFLDGRIAESPEKLRGYAAYFSAVLGHRKFKLPPCNSPQISAAIDVDGSIRPCFFLPVGGNIREESLSKALNHKSMLKLRGEFRKKSRKECERCVCPIVYGD